MKLISTFSYTEEIADQYVLTELYWYPSWYSVTRKFASSITGLEIGSEPCSAHQRLYCPKRSHMTCWFLSFMTF